MDTRGQKHVKSFFTYSVTRCSFDPRRDRTQNLSGYGTKRNAFASTWNQIPVLQSYSPLHNHHAAKLRSPVEAGIMMRLQAGQPRSRGSILDRGKICSLFLHVQTGGIEPTSYSMCTGVSFPKRAWNWPLTSISRRGYEWLERHHYSPLYALMPCTRIPLPFYASQSFFICFFKCSPQRKFFHIEFAQVVPKSKGTVVPNRPCRPWGVQKS